MLYSFRGAIPTGLPHRIRLASGETRTDVNTFTAAELTSAGWFPVADPPAVGLAQVLDWLPDQRDWLVRDRTPAEWQQLQQQLIAEYATQVQQRLDAFAQSRMYDNMLSLCSYHSDDNLMFRAEAVRGMQLRSATWTALHQLLQQVQQGIRPIPAGFADLEPLLPDLTWSDSENSESEQLL